MNRASEGRKITQILAFDASGYFCRKYGLRSSVGSGAGAGVRAAGVLAGAAWTAGAGSTGSRETAGPGAERGGTGRCTSGLEPTATGTRLSITEDGSVYNPIYRFVSRFFLGYTTTADAYLDALEARMVGRGAAGAALVEPARRPG